MDTKLINIANVRKHEAGGEPEKFKAQQSSNESLASVIFPWRVQRKEARRPIVSTTETGRTISTTGFYMCTMSVMLLTTGIGLTAASGWTLIYRIPYVYLSGGSIFLGTDSFTLIAGVLSFPCCWIVWICHNNKKYYTILPVLIGLLGISICLMSTTLVITFFDRFHANVRGSVHPELHVKEILNRTMTTAMASYNTKFRARLSWDMVQHRLKCCGKDGPADWLRLGLLPPCSCFLYEAASSPKILFMRGCLDRIMEDLVLENNFLTCICLVAVCVHIGTLTLANLTYLREILSRKNVEAMSIS